MSGPPTNNGAGSSQLTDPLSFASKLFQQIGNADFSLDEDSRSESDADDSSEDDDCSQTQSTKTTRPLEPIHSDQDQSDGHLSKKAKLEAMTNLINSGIPGAATKSQTQTQAQTHGHVTPLSVDTPSQIQFSQFNLQSAAGTPMAPGTPTPRPQEFNLTLPPQVQKKLREVPIATPPQQSSKPQPRQPSVQSVSSSPSSTASASSSTLPSTPISAKPAKVIDLTMAEETTEISDDEVVIDESRTTTVANRNMCFGMIQSLVVTLYPRHLEYEEGKADRVIIKRATTAGKASLAVEHESGLVCILWPFFFFYS